MRVILSLLVLFISTQTFAASVDTVSIYSHRMQKSYKCVVIKPNTYNQPSATFPTVYLLHGFSGAYDNWIKKVPQLKQYADTYQLLIVCPDAAYSSWYFDSPVDSTVRFETYIAREVPAYIEANYHTIKNRTARAITGLSMGGHGGLFLGFRHADYFGACGSMSGALLIDYITRGYDVEKRLGDTITNRHYYKELSIMTEMEHYPKDSVAIIMDCGTEDFVIEMSRAAHQKMLELHLPHDYTERPGKHDWNYWANAVQYQLLYFKNYFDRQQKGTGTITNSLPAKAVKN